MVDPERKMIEHMVSAVQAELRRFSDKILGEIDGRIEDAISSLRNEGRVGALNSGDLESVSKRIDLISEQQDVATKRTEEMYGQLNLQREELMRDIEGIVRGEVENSKSSVAFSDIEDVHQMLDQQTKQVEIIASQIRSVQGAINAIKDSADESRDRVAQAEKAFSEQIAHFEREFARFKMNADTSVISERFEQIERALEMIEVPDVVFGRVTKVPE